MNGPSDKSILEPQFHWFADQWSSPSMFLAYICHHSFLDSISGRNRAPIPVYFQACLFASCRSFVFTTS